MNLKKLIPSLLLFIAFIAFHNSFENNLFELGLSWTMSGIAPYFLQFISAVLFGIQFNLFGPLESIKRRRIISVSSVIVLCGIAFAVHPIYEGDFDNTFDEIHLASKTGEVPEGLTMIALPGCPFCKSRVKTLNQLYARNPRKEIQVILASSDADMLSYYKKNLSAGIQALNAKNPQFYAELAQGRFPCFIYNDGTGDIRRWAQNGFGSSALDWIEKR